MERIIELIKKYDVCKKRRSAFLLMLPKQAGERSSSSAALNRNERGMEERERDAQ